MSSTPFINFIVLLCIKKLNGERTIFSIYHLLCGKKSSQTIQDAHLFHLTPFFNTYRQLTREELERIILNLQEQNLLVKQSEQMYITTEKGNQFIERHQSSFPFLKWLNGYQFQHAQVVWERLSLLVQVISHITNHDPRYIPIQRNKEIQSWVKAFLKENTMERQELSRALYQELVGFFQGIEELDRKAPALIVLRFTGYNAIGLTKKQVCDKLKIEETLYHYQFLATLHLLMYELVNKKENYPLLSFLLQDFHLNHSLTVSTRKTLELLKRGYSIEEISQMRNLKTNTIQDHIVELAIQLDEFDITPYVEKKKINQILMAKNKATSKQLRQIRQWVPDASYFEIRLVLTKMGDRNED